MFDIFAIYVSMSTCHPGTRQFIDASLHVHLSSEGSLAQKIQPFIIKKDYWLIVFLVLASEMGREDAGRWVVKNGCAPSLKNTQWAA